MSGIDALYAYAVIPAGASVPLAPRHVLADVGLDLVSAGPVSAIVSPVPRAAFTESCDAETTAARALGHHAVVTAASAEGPCLPLAYGALFSSRAPLIDWLSARSRKLTDALADLGTAAEWTAMVEEDEASHGAWLGAADAEIASLSDTLNAAGAGRAYLLSRKLEKLRLTKRAERLGQVVADAAALVEATAPMLERRSGGGKARLTALVRHDQAAALGAALAALAAQVSGTGIAVALTGPWPAYGFARSITSDE